MDPQIIAAYVAGLFLILSLFVKVNYEKENNRKNDADRFSTLIVKVDSIAHELSEFKRESLSELQQEKIDRFQKEIKTIQNLGEKFADWKYCHLWLQKEKENLVDRVVRRVSKEKKISPENQKVLKSNLLIHLLWVLSSLKNGTGRIRLNLERFNLKRFKLDDSCQITDINEASKIYKICFAEMFEILDNSINPWNPKNWNPSNWGMTKLDSNHASIIKFFVKNLEEAYKVRIAKN